MKLIFNSAQADVKVVPKQVLGIFAQNATPAMMKSIYFRIAGVVVFAFLIFGLFFPVYTFKSIILTHNFEDYSPDARFQIFFHDYISYTIDYIYDTYNLFYNRQNWGIFWDVLIYKQIISDIDPDFKPAGIPLEILRYARIFNPIYLYIFFFGLSAILYHVLLCVFPIFVVTKSLFKSSKKVSMLFTFFTFLLVSYCSYFIVIRFYNNFISGYASNELENLFNLSLDTYLEFFTGLYQMSSSPLHKLRFQANIRNSFSYVTIFEQYLLTDECGYVLSNNPDKPKIEGEEFLKFKQKIKLCIHYETEFLRYYALRKITNVTGMGLIEDSFFNPLSCETISKYTLNDFTIPLENQTFGSQENIDQDLVTNTVSNYISSTKSNSLINGLVPTFFEAAKVWYLPLITAGVNGFEGFEDFDILFDNDRMRPFLIKVNAFRSLAPPYVDIESVSSSDPRDPFVWFFRYVGIKIDELYLLNPGAPYSKQRFIDGHNFVRAVLPVDITYGRMNLEEIMVTDHNMVLTLFPFTVLREYLSFDEMEKFDIQHDYLFRGAQQYDVTTSDFYIEDMLEHSQDLSVVTSDLMHTISPLNSSKDIESLPLEELKTRSHFFFYTNLFDTYLTLDYDPLEPYDPEVGVANPMLDYNDFHGLCNSCFNSVTGSGSHFDVGYSNQAILLYRGVHDTTPSAEQYTSDLFLISFEHGNPLWMFYVYWHAYFDPIQTEIVYTNRILLSKVRHAMHLKCGFYHLFLLCPENAYRFVPRLWYRIFVKIHLIYFSRLWGLDWDRSTLDIARYTVNEYAENSAYYFGSR